MRARISAINWIGDEEAEVTISDGVFECCAFCHPCDLEVGTSLDRPLSLLDHFEVHRTTEQAQLEQRKNRWEHEIVGRVISISQQGNFKLGKIRVGDIDLDDIRLPGDIEIGDTVFLIAERIDVVA